MEEAKKPYALLTVGDTDYRLKFSASAAIDAEKKLGKSLIMAFRDIGSVTVQVILLWAALQKYNHKTSMETASKIYDDFMESDNGGLENLVEILTETLEASGFMKPRQKDAAEEAKDATKM